MAYRALYRQYRPALFSEVIGQEHMITILKNQIATGHIAHAYLFCGTRGTGKTSTAKIFARAVNCLAPADGEPCGVCDGCVAARAENNPDITEIDAASNTGVDNVRALIEQAQYAPMLLRRRVFIIDEVHMLSGSAFNALLKTLEEPPAHVVFILATTEPQKLPATIISRCQRFDFHRISVSEIAAATEAVLKKAGASVEKEGVLLIARAADGSMRDALSLADQCLSFCGGQVTKHDVYDVLGSMEEGFLFDLADALFASDAQKALTMLDEVSAGGRDLVVFLQDLTAHIRALLLSRACGRCEKLLDCSEESMTRYLKQAESVPEERLLLALELLLSAQGSIRYLSAPRILLENALLRIARPEASRSLLALEARVAKLESALAGVPARAAAPAQEAPVQKIEKKPAPEQAATSPVKGGDAPVQKAEEPAIKPATPEKAAAKAAKPQPDTVDDNAASVWGAVLAQMRAQNIFVHEMARVGLADSLQDGVLSVKFTAEYQVQYAGTNVPSNLKKLQAILDSVRPDTKLVLTRSNEQAPKPDPTSPSEEAARALFGDRLIIE